MGPLGPPPLLLVWFGRIELQHTVRCRTALKRACHLQRKLSGSDPAGPSRGSVPVMRIGWHRPRLVAWSRSTFLCCRCQTALRPPTTGCVDGTDPVARGRWRRGPSASRTGTRLLRLSCSVLFELGFGNGQCVKLPWNIGPPCLLAL